MNWENFKHLFHESYHLKMKHWVESEECNDVYKFLKNETRRGVQIAPLSPDVYKVFTYPLDDVKCLLLAYCPYANFYNGAPVADGIAFSCNFGKMQPSLLSFYGGIEHELYDGLNLEYYQNSNLDYLSSQGVMLLNSALTVQKDVPGSYNKIWEPFIKYILENVFAYSGIPVVLIGKDAQENEKYMFPSAYKHVFRIEHPSYAARKVTIWDTQGTFGKINTLLMNNNGLKIEWLNELPF
jgi:uracil-DNA glycosylase